MHIPASLTNLLTVGILSNHHSLDMRIQTINHQLTGRGRGARGNKRDTQRRKRVRQLVKEAPIIGILIKIGMKIVDLNLIGGITRRRNARQ